MTFSTFTRSTTEQRTERAPRLRVASRSKPRAMSAVVIGGAVLLALAAWFVSTPARAAGPSVALESPRIDQGNIRSLQAGARHFINNCMGCHSVEFSRYSRVAEDLGLSEEDVAENFIFTTDAEGEPTKVGATMVWCIPVLPCRMSCGITKGGKHCPRVMMAMAARSRR